MTAHIIKEMIEKEIESRKWAPLTEVAFHRIFNKYFEDGFIAISANRSCEAEKGVEKCSPEDRRKQERVNRLNLIALKKAVRQAGYDFVPVMGGYPEELPDGGTIEVEEPSLIIPDNKGDSEKLKALGVSLARRFNQDSVLWKPANEEDPSAYLIDQAGKEVMSFGSIKPNDMTNIFYSYLKKGNKQNKRWSLNEANIRIQKIPSNILSASGRQGELYFFPETGLPFHIGKRR